MVGDCGTDTLRLDSSEVTLGLTAIRDKRFVDVEIFDIRGSGANALTLDYQKVVNLSSASNTVRVRQDAGDTAYTGAGWTSGGQQLIDSVRYDIVTQGVATLDVEAIAPPTATITVDDTSLIIGETSDVTIVFSEAPTWFAINDLSATGGTLSTFTAIDADSFTVRFTANKDRPRNNCRMSFFAPR